jgi:serine/threonine protein phosphatase PrpC
MNHRVNRGDTCYGEFAIVADGVGGSVKSGGQPGWVAQRFCEEIAEALVDREDQAGPLPLLEVIRVKARDRGGYLPSSPARNCDKEEGEMDGFDRAAACLVACQLVGDDQLQVYGGGDSITYIFRPKLFTHHAILPGTNGHDLVIHRQRQMQIMIETRDGERAGPMEQLGMGYRIQSGSLLDKNFSGQNSVQLEDGDVIIMGTDGLVDNLAYRDKNGQEISDEHKDIQKRHYKTDYDATSRLASMVLQWWRQGNGNLDPAQLVRWLLRQPGEHARLYPNMANLPSEMRDTCALKYDSADSRDDITVVVGVVKLKLSAGATPAREPSPGLADEVPPTTRENREELAKGKRAADPPRSKDPKKFRVAYSAPR